jgi:hypothetical protein
MKFEKGHVLGKESRIVSGNSCCTLVQNVGCSDIQTDIVLVILCGFEIWCLTSRAEHGFRICERRAVRRIFGVREVRIEGYKGLCN